MKRENEYYCLNCGRNFNNEDAVTIHDHAQPPSEPDYDVCPFCGDDNLSTDVYECEVCGKCFDMEDMFAEDICLDCANMGIRANREWIENNKPMTAEEKEAFRIVCHIGGIWNDVRN